MYMECSDFNYSSLDFENQLGKGKVASTTTEKTIQITVEQQTSEYANKLVAYFVNFVNAEFCCDGSCSNKMGHTVNLLINAGSQINAGFQ